MDKKTYTAMMAAIDGGKKVTRAEHDELTAFAGAKRLRKPKADAARATRSRNADAECSAVGCEKKAYCKGMCSAHYAQARREDPAEREKAREASRRSYAKRAEAQKAAAKPAEKSAK